MFPFTPIILTDISQNARVNIAQNARACFVQFAGGGAIAHNRQAGEGRLYFLYIAPGYNSGTKNYKKLQMVFSDQFSHQKFFSIQITINIFFNSDNNKKK